MSIRDTKLNSNIIGHTRVKWLKVLHKNAVVKPGEQKNADTHGVEYTFETREQTQQNVEEKQKPASCMEHTSGRRKPSGYNDATYDRIPNTQYALNSTW